MRASIPVGLMHQMWAIQGEDDGAFFADTTSEVKLADQLGYDSVWLAEHHFMRPGSFYPRLPDPELFMARLAGETERIRLATGIKILILDTPLRTAERMLLLDVLLQHRALFAVGQGSPGEIDHLGLGVEDKRRRFRADLVELAAYLRGEPTKAGLGLTPAPQATLDQLLWVGVRDPVSVALAAELDANFIVGEAEPAAKQRSYVGGYRAAGGAGEVRGARLVFVAETDEEAERSVEAPATALFDTFGKGQYHREAVEGGFTSSAAPTSLRDVLRHLDYIVGTPETVAAELDEYVRATGSTALNIMIHSPGLAHDDVCRALTLFAAEVAPRLSPPAEGLPRRALISNR